MSSPEPPTETPGSSAPTWPTQPTYCNLGEVRAHLLSSKACGTPTSGSSSTDPQPLPPPLPKKILARARSLPTHRVFSPSPTPAGKPPRLLLGSRSVDKSQASDDEARPACPPAELPFCSLDTELGLSLHDLHCPEAVHAALEARQLEGLQAVQARLRARFLGGRPGPCCSHHSFRLLDSLPCVESGDALYYRMVQVDKEVWHVLDAKVPKPGSQGAPPVGPGAAGLAAPALQPPGAVWPGARRCTARGALERPRGAGGGGTGEHGGPVAGGSRRAEARRLCLGRGPAFAAAEWSPGAPGGPGRGPDRAASREPAAGGAAGLRGLRAPAPAASRLRPRSPTALGTSGRPRAAAGPPAPHAAQPGALGHSLDRGPGAPGSPAGPRTTLRNHDARGTAGAALGAGIRATWPRNTAGALAAGAPHVAGPEPCAAGRWW
ncbi:PREDICTED: putative uncharacterized protein C19orf35 homolog isoform X2 [Hipposideros armiger]|uniref:PEAK family member 3 n=1 Tax=Hipposideros armiger TaxID=186990 RepID=A0A8B7SLB9_HIPAR|nr:PREDICTED: putative uncharacterized protein C19orf35 homolog isoform X2 [Hipposideros armiger]